MNWNVKEKKFVLWIFSFERLIDKLLEHKSGESWQRKNLFSQSDSIFDMEQWLEMTIMWILLQKRKIFVVLFIFYCFELAWQKLIDFRVKKSVPWWDIWRLISSDRRHPHRHQPAQCHIITCILSSFLTLIITTIITPPSILILIVHHPLPESAQLRIRYQQHQTRRRHLQIVSEWRIWPLPMSSSVKLTHHG